MKSIAGSQLTGKWYKITRNPKGEELNFIEIFVYLSMSNEKFIDVLYVGVKEDRSKILRKSSLKIMKGNYCGYIVSKRLFYRKRYKVLLFDEENGIAVLSDMKKRTVSVYSKRSMLSHELLEDSLRRIDFSSYNDEVKIYSGHVV